MLNWRLKKHHWCISQGFTTYAWMNIDDRGTAFCTRTRPCVGSSSTCNNWTDCHWLQQRAFVCAFSLLLALACSQSLSSDQLWRYDISLKLFKVCFSSGLIQHLKWACNSSKLEKWSLVEQKTQQNSKSGVSRLDHMYCQYVHVAWCKCTRSLSPILSLHLSHDNAGFLKSNCDVWN